MAILPVLQAGNPVLKNISTPVEKFDKKLRKLLDDMADTMYESNGVGLAAPQIGINKRIIVIDIGEGLFEFINPKIVKAEGSQVCENEGCLSVPGFFGTVERALDVEVEAFNRFGKKFKFSATEYMSQAIQHEIDHLDGILFIDRASSIMRAEQVKSEED